MRARVCVVHYNTLCVCGEEAFQILNVRETLIPHAEKFSRGHGAFCFSIKGTALLVERMIS